MHLDELNETYLASFLELVRDFERDDFETYSAVFALEPWNDLSTARFLKDCGKERMDWRPKAGQQSVTHYVLVDNGQVCGYGRLRFPVDTEGPVGNLEFMVPPSKRRKGYGTHTLNKMLFEAVRAGLARALVVCRDEDPAAIRCIQYNRGEKIEEDSRGNLLRYWIRFR